MNKTTPIKILVSLLILLLFTISCIIGYSTTVINFNGDSYGIYGWVKDIFENHVNPLAWTTAPGYNIFSYLYIFAYIIGFFTHHDVMLFLIVYKISQILALLGSIYAFIFLIELPKLKNIKSYIYLIPAFYILYVFLCVNIDGCDGALLLYNDKDVLLNDACMLLTTGYLLKIIILNQRFGKLPKWHFALFIMLSLYLAATNLRYAACAIPSQLVLISFLYIRNLLNSNSIQSQTKKNVIQSKNSELFTISKSTTLILISTLIMTCICAYFTYFILEYYSSSSRYLYFSSIREPGDPLKIFKEFFINYGNTFSEIVLHTIYIGSLLLGLMVILINLSPYNKFKTSTFSQFPCSSLFALLTTLSFITVVIIGMAQGGINYWNRDLTSLRYFDLSIIYAYLCCGSVIIECSKIMQQHSSKISLSILSITSIFAIYKFTNDYKTVKYPYSNLYSCLIQNKQKYQLHDGIGDYWVVRPIMAYSTFTPNLNLHVFGTEHLPIGDFIWMSNIYQPVNYTNYLIYSNINPEYKARIMPTLYSLLPNLSTQQIECGNDDSGGTIIVFDPDSAQKLTEMLNQYATNARSLFSMSNYSFGQSLWNNLRHNNQFIRLNHSYKHFGSMLTKSNPNVKYENNIDQSVTVNNILGDNTPVLTNMYPRLASGTYNIQIDYTSNQNAEIGIFNPETKQLEAQWLLNASATISSQSFTITNKASMIIIIMLPNNNSIFTIKDVTLTKSDF